MNGCNKELQGAVDHHRVQGVAPIRGFSCVVVWSSSWQVPFAVPQILSAMQVAASHPVQPNTVGRRPCL